MIKNSHRKLLSCDNNEITELWAETTTKLLMSSLGFARQQLLRHEAPWFTWLTNHMTVFRVTHVTPQICGHPCGQKARVHGMLSWLRFSFILMGREKLWELCDCPTEDHNTVTHAQVQTHTTWRIVQLPPTTIYTCTEVKCASGQVFHTAGAYPGFWNNWEYFYPSRWDASPSQGYP